MLSNIQTLLSTPSSSTSAESDTQKTVSIILSYSHTRSVLQMCGRWGFYETAIVILEFSSPTSSKPSSIYSPISLKDLKLIFETGLIEQLYVDVVEEKNHIDLDIDDSFLIFNRLHNWMDNQWWLNQ